MSFFGELGEKNLSPHDLLKFEQGRLFNLLLDPISKMEKEGYARSFTESVAKSVKSWLHVNRLVLVGRISIRGTEEMPSLVEEKAPSQQELAAS